MDVAGSAPLEAHYHMDVAYLLPKLRFKRGAWGVWHSELSQHQLGSRPAVFIPRWTARPSVGLTLLLLFRYGTQCSIAQELRLATSPCWRHAHEVAIVFPTRSWCLSISPSRKLPQGGRYQVDVILDDILYTPVIRCGRRIEMLRAV